MVLTAIKNHLKIKSLFEQPVIAKKRIIEKYISVASSDFIANSPEATTIDHLGYKATNNSGVVQTLRANIHLPHGANIVSAAAFGSSAISTWELKAGTQAGAESAIANGNVNTPSSTIVQAEATVDNSLKCYYFKVAIANTVDIYHAYVLIEIEEITD